MYSGVETFGKVVEHRAAAKPYTRFVRFENTDVTYNQFNCNGNKVANYITELGLTKGSTCAVMLPNSPEFLYTWLGLAKVGVIEVPINVAFRGHLLTYILNKAECQAIVISSQWVDRLLDILGDLTHLRHVIVVGDDYKAIPGLLTTHFFEYILDTASDAPVNVEIKPTDPSLILFTSGTTGPSKGVVLTHRSNFKNASNCCDVMKYGPNDRLFTVFPLFHANARYTTVLSALLADCDVVLHDKFSASRFWDICREEKITAFNFMGSVITILMKQPERSNDKDHLVRKAFGGPTPLDLYDDFQHRFGVQISEIYGLTELGTVTNNPAESFRKGSCGKAASFYEVEIHDEEDNPCLPGVAGEIVVRPKDPGIMFTEYYGMPEATLKTWQNLWFHTGDRGRMDEDGYIYFMDRKKDAIRRRGENISSFEVEVVINEHPKVLDSAAVGVPSELGEEEVMVVIIVKEGEELTPGELLDYCQPRMAYFALPRFVRFVKEFPRTPSQRVQKYKLREEGITPDTWDRELVGYKVHR
ncbi:AMP-binding protein [Peribacillus asahii]|uniref:AMP-binding protein n=1 Tax=Peribacillus asahii TaxID=228899 RepID=UPI0020793313|nr:AMP-binding protein [Peribacillus asahii]USK68714.1 AMP-binding protein [Peribacillus asahii]